jgi:hypothetical protein
MPPGAEGAQETCASIGALRSITAATGGICDEGIHDGLLP